MRLVEPPNQKESQFEHLMKHLTRILLLMVITLSLSITTMANAQNNANKKLVITYKGDTISNKKDTIINKYRDYLEDERNTIDEEDNSYDIYKNNFINLCTTTDNFFIEDIMIDANYPELSMDSIKRDSIKMAFFIEIDSVFKDVYKKKYGQNDNTSSNETSEKSLKWNRKTQWKWLFGIGGLLVVVTIISLWNAVKKNQKKKYGEAINKAVPGKSTDDVGIVVRHKTMSVMQKQNIDDVKGNGNYMEVACSDFCDDSAVTKMYIKNTCIIGIYNMYAEDLRNPENPKEDGCMVLGRWVHDEQNDEYCVSLEEIVLPGSDAVFSEYQLNFGGQIKMKMMEQLKKMRQETELQYDLTCWVHSHPGLGVFFSNDDHNVHILHKHPTHPKFLTAIVIDILTPEQELGIFTFKHDESINSQYDLKKLYSLAEWYKWAVKSKQNSLRSEDHFNTLKDAPSHSNDCYRIELTNGAIIDMDKLTAFPKNKPVHFVHGFTNLEEKQSIHVATKIDEAESVPDYDLVGCFVVVTNRSLPSITKATSNYYKRIKFVLVYSTSDGLLTTIPVINNGLCNDESFYGEQQLEDLKIWTRRKR